MPIIFAIYVTLAKEMTSIKVTLYYLKIVWLKDVPESENTWLLEPVSSFTLFFIQAICLLQTHNSARKLYFGRFYLLSFFFVLYLGIQLTYDARDTSFTNSDDRCRAAVTMDYDIPFNSGRFRTLYVSICFPVLSSHLFSSQLYFAILLDFFKFPFVFLSFGISFQFTAFLFVDLPFPFLRLRLSFVFFLFLFLSFHFPLSSSFSLQELSFSFCQFFYLCSLLFFFISMEKKLHVIK